MEADDSDSEVFAVGDSNSAHGSTIKWTKDLLTKYFDEPCENKKRKCKLCKNETFLVSLIFFNNLKAGPIIIYILDFSKNF